MTFTNAAIGLAAMGAGFLVARVLKARRAGETAYVGGLVHEPPEPSQLIGYPMPNFPPEVAQPSRHASP